MESRSYVIYGNPVAWSRPSPSHANRMWDTQKQLKFEYGILLKKQHQSDLLFEGPLLLKITFYFRIPKSGKKQQGDFHMYKPDLSNLIKLIEDVGSGILYHDDALIANITAEKRYDATPRIEFSIIPLEKEQRNDSQKEKSKCRTSKRA